GTTTASRSRSMDIGRVGIGPGRQAGMRRETRLGCGRGGQFCCRLTLDRSASATQTRQPAPRRPAVTDWAWSRARRRSAGTLLDALKFRAQLGKGRTGICRREVREDAGRAQLRRHLREIYQGFTPLDVAVGDGLQRLFCAIGLPPTRLDVAILDGSQEAV